MSRIVTDLERDLASPELKVIAEPVALTAHTLAPMNKCLAQNNKSPDRSRTTNKRNLQERVSTEHWGAHVTLNRNEPIDLLRCHFDLTPAEARLALHLVAGEALRSAAVKLSISYETARTYLKNIFRKTGTCRQAELVVVILTALPDCLKQPVT